MSVNKPTKVAEIIGVATKTAMDGKAIYIKGNKGGELRVACTNFVPQCMGEQPTIDFCKGY